MTDKPGYYPTNRDPDLDPKVDPAYNKPRDALLPDDDKSEEEKAKDDRAKEDKIEEEKALEHAKPHEYEPGVEDFLASVEAALRDPVAVLRLAAVLVEVPRQAERVKAQQQQANA